jgi:hypothetical protein
MNAHQRRSRGARFEEVRAGQVFARPLPWIIVANPTDYRANRWLLVLGDALYSVNVCLRLTVRNPAHAILMIWSGARGPTLVDAARSSSVQPWVKLVPYKYVPYSTKRSRSPPPAMPGQRPEAAPFAFCMSDNVVRLVLDDKLNRHARISGRALLGSIGFTVHRGISTPRFEGLAEGVGDVL